MKLKDKTIVISGGTKGIGRRLVDEMLLEGANVVIGGREEGYRARCPNHHIVGNRPSPYLLKK